MSTILFYLPPILFTSYSIYPILFTSIILDYGAYRIELDTKMCISDYKLFEYHDKVIILGPKDYDLITSSPTDISRAIAGSLLFIHDWFEGRNVKPTFTHIVNYGDYLLSMLYYIILHTQDLETIRQARILFNEVTNSYTYFNPFRYDMHDLIHDRKLVLVAIAINIIALQSL